MGQYYLRQRYYDATTGRFTRRDTYEGRLEEPVTLHKYLYANGNPVSYTDPTGLFSLGELNASMAISSILNASIGYIQGERTLGAITTNILVGAVQGAIFYGVGLAAFKAIARLARGAKFSRYAKGLNYYFKNKIVKLPGARTLPNSSIPDKFMLKLSWGRKVMISSGRQGGTTTGGLKHLVNEVLERQFGQRTVGQASHTKLAEMLALEELEYVIRQAMAQGIKSHTPMYVNTGFARWELIFEKVGRHWKLYHAVIKLN